MSILDDLKDLNTEDVLNATKSAMKAADAALSGKPFEAVDHALDAVLALVPYEDLSKHLDAAAVRRGKAIKNIADDAKFDEQGNLRR